MMHARIYRLLLGILLATSLIAATSPTPPPPNSLNSGLEGSKASLVRIELIAQAEIAHIDHTTGDVAISRGRSAVPLGAATGVLVSADGIVATTWENLAVDEAAVAVYAANELFANVIGVPVVGNDADPARRGSTPDAYWAPHLQHCYDQVQHCVLFRVAQYRVQTYTSKPGSVMAELLNSPAGPEGVALLQISGGGSAPTATLSAPDAASAEDSLMVGFTAQPKPGAGPAELPVTVDRVANRISSQQDLEALLDAGVSGGPVLDVATGQLVGLTGPLQPNGQASLIPAAAIQSALVAAGVETSPSKFDAVFRRGIDHLSSGNTGGSAQGALEESLTYYDSALAASHLEQARALSNEPAANDPAAGGSGAESTGLMPGALLASLVGILLVGGIFVAVARRRRNVATAAGSENATSGQESRSAPATTVTAAPVGARQSLSSERTGPGRTRLVRTERMPGGEPQPSTPVPPPAATGQASAFCSQCGWSLRPGARFCVGCGHPVG